MSVKVRIIADSREELAEAITLIAEKVGQERLGSYRFPKYPGRQGEWLLYFSLDTNTPTQSTSENPTS
jgi:hypothetical protein